MKKLVLIFALLIGAALLPEDATAQALPCPHFICEQDPNLTTYAVANTVGSTYQWTVLGGLIVSGQGTNSIEVNWAAVLPGNYSVEVVETDANGCDGDPVLCNVTINPTPVTGAITHD